jgi:Bacterial Ig domain
MKSFAGPFAALLLAATGCQQPGTTTFAGDLVLPASSGIGVHEAAVTNGDGPNGAHIIFLNFDGATITPDSSFRDNSAANQSQIPNSTSTVAAFDATPYAPAFTQATAEAAITNYFKGFYAPFNVQVVTTRPTGVRYTMCMIGGSPSEIGIGQGAAGIAPLDCGNTNEPDICYAFSSVLDPSNTGSATESLKAIAVTCAQETAHTFGLGHTTNMNDIMYPQLTFTANGFAMGPQTLQNDGSGQCSAPATTQDSYNMLMGVIGPASGTPMTGPTPTVAFVTPTDGSTVPLTFDIIVAASETGGSIAHVDIDAMGQSLGSLTAAPYKLTGITAPQDGMYTLTATAYDAAGAFQAASVTFTAMTGAPAQNEGCQTSNDCNAPLVCMNMQCVMPTTMGGACSDSNPCPSGQTCGSDGTCSTSMSTGPQPGQTGASCTDNSQCANGLCASIGNQSFCTQQCDPTDATSCPKNMKCVADSGGHYCEPSGNGDNGTSSGGCSTTPGASGDFGGMLAALCLVLGFFLARRRLAR